MRCYYDVLSIESCATAHEIKKAFHIHALKWHPDKHQQSRISIEEATETFQDIQNAYRVLINPSERKWYDHHRDQLLQHDRDAFASDGSIVFDHYTRDSAFEGYNDDVRGFFAVYSGAFQHILDLEETTNGLPEFGKITDQIEAVQEFYVKWKSFSTIRSFSWMNIYTTTEDTTRMIRRAVEKENRRRREKAKKEYNQMVRKLVEFVRQRDSRILDFEQERKSQRELQRKAKAQEKLEKRIVYEQAKISFQRQQTELWERNQADSEASRQNNTYPDQTFDDALNECGIYMDDAMLICEICDQTFSTNKQLRNHLNSRKHGEPVALMKVDGEFDDSVSTHVELENLTMRVDLSDSVDDTIKLDQKSEQNSLAEKAMSPISTAEKLMDKNERRFSKEVRAAEKRRERKEKRKSKKKLELNVLTHLRHK
uniref:Uncharacterized protein AlNc14C5G695 n=1 Tax=Albugo laibachii Nc14 TaxID=890382 RepID=F0W0R0_9STRA|nr:hypothetical protein BRAFLDRAFT_277565 [Albugo laibachii Nc14]|eukprot:CCA14634.1 hypothetical protein BRAFLDRAFT_277565 [Albugo laibachii Nc14]